MTLQQELQLRLANADLSDISQLMGYRARIEHCQSRIRTLLTDPHLGLGQGGFDFKFSDLEFLLHLCRLLGIDLDAYSAEVEVIQRELEERRTAFRPYIFIDTGFQRTTEPVFVLALFESKRRIMLDEVTRKMPLDQQVRYVQSIVSKHFDEHDGQLGVWGSIQHYLFNYDTGVQLVIHPDGSVQKEVEASAEPRAEMKCSGGSSVILALESQSWNI